MEVPAFRLLAAAALLLAFMAGLVSRWRRRSKYDVHRIPGPPAYPIVGNMPQILKWKKPQMHLIVHEWIKKYGKVVKVDMGVGGGLGLHVIDPEFIQNNITGHGARGMPKSPFYNHLQKVSIREVIDIAIAYPDLLKPVSTNEATVPVHVQLATPSDQGYFITDLKENDYWRAVRKAMAKAFSTGALKDAFPKVARKADEFVEVIKRSLSAEPIEFQHLLTRFMFDVVGVAGFGIDFKFLQNVDHPILEAIEFCTHDSLASSINPFRRLVKWTFPWCKLAQECKSMYSQMYGFYNMIVEEMRGRGDPAADDMSMSACMMRIKDPKTGGPLNDALLSSEVGGFLVAGTDTTSHEIMWALFAIASHPEIQHKIVDELKASGLLLRIREGGAGRVSYSDIMGLEYLGMAMKEALRMFPVSPFGTVRVTPEDGMRVYGYRVPKNTVVFVNAHGINHSPWIWDDPDSYNPERWCRVPATEQSETVFAYEPLTKNDSRNLWTFSDGPRDCLGQRMAVMEMHLVVAVLLAHFRLRVAERMGGWDAALSRQYIGLLLCIDGGMWLHCDPRQDLEE